MVDEARLEAREPGLTPVTDGWFVVNVRDAAWEEGPFGAACFFENAEAPFPHLGINLRVLSRGRSRWLYHAEPSQEDFLVLAGECLLLVEGTERRLKAWDFVHCPPGTEHAFVATGADPCVIVMTGAPRSDGTSGVYPRSELALRHGVGVEQETRSAAEAQAGFPEWRFARPEEWDHRLPWAR